MSTDIGAGLYGYAVSRETARIEVIGVPFDATTSYRPGTADGPAAVLAASPQIDFDDFRFGRVDKAGIWMAPIDQSIRELSRKCRAISEGPIERVGFENDEAALRDQAEAMCAEVESFVTQACKAARGKGRVPILLGGEHGVSYAAIAESAASHGPIGVLQIDAHMDLREAYCGLVRSHASVMYRVLTEAQGIDKLVQVGIRDCCTEERELATEDGRVRTFYDDDLADAAAAGTPWIETCKRIVDELPERVHISFDIDGLEPSLCPHTGTPVPGGLSWREASVLLATVAESGREIVGADLVEVAPGPDGDEWDGNVGARALYRLCGVIAATNGMLE